MDTIYVSHVYRESGKAFLPKKIPSRTVKHGGGSLMFFFFFFFFGGVCLPLETGRLVKIDGIMNKEKYVELLDHNLKQSARDLSLGRRWSFVQDNDPKHTAKFTKKLIVK